MSKFHLTDQGPRTCTATARACPLGGEHFDSLEQAEAAYAAQHDVMTGLKKTSGELQGSVVTTVKPQAGGRYYGCHVSETSVKPHLDAFRAAVGDEKADLMEANKANRDRGRVYHLTVVTPPEMKGVKGGIGPFPETVTINYSGVGMAEDKGSEAWFVVCASDEIADWREENGLEPKDLHVTLGFAPKDVHTKPKGQSSLTIS